MKKKLQELPEALQKQVIYRGGSGILFLLCTIIILIFYQDIYFMLPCLGFSALLLANTFWLFREAYAKHYIIVEGKCCGFEKTPMHKRIKNIYIETEEATIKLIVRQRIKHLVTGDIIRVYVNQNTPVYDQGECKMLCTYLALERIRKEKHSNDSREFTDDFGRNSRVDSEKCE